MEIKLKLALLFMGRFRCKKYMVNAFTHAHCNVKRNCMKRYQLSLISEKNENMTMQVYKTRFDLIILSVQQNVIFKSIGLIQLTKI